MSRPRDDSRDDPRDAALRRAFGGDHDGAGAPPGEPPPPRAGRLLGAALLVHALVLVARWRWVERDLALFAGSALAAAGVFLLVPALIVVLALGASARRDRPRVLRAVAFAWLLTALIHALVVLGAATVEPPAS